MANVPVRLIEAIAGDLKEEVKKPKACPFWQGGTIQSNFQVLFISMWPEDASKNLLKGRR